MQNLHVTSFYMTYKREINSNLEKKIYHRRDVVQNNLGGVDRAGAAG
jgi:hypothetical protein